MASTLIIYLNLIVDSFWVSGLNADALTAIGFVSPIYVIIIGMGECFGSGINSVMSRFKSAGENEDANNTIIHTTVLAVITYFILFFIGKFFVDTLIVWVGGESVLPLCRAYIQPALMLSIFLMAPDINAGLYRASGDVKRSSNSFIVIAIFNIIFDPIFIYVLNFGISGAIYATILSSILGLVYMNIDQNFRKDIILPVKNPNYKFQPRLFKELLIVSIPVALNDMAYSIFSISVNYLIIFTAGIGEIASYVIVKQLIRFVYAPSTAIGSIIITVTGVNYASKIWDKLEEGINYATTIGLGITIIIALIFFIFPHQFCGIFSLTLSDTNVIDRAAEILMIMVFLNLLSPLQVISLRSFQ
nr:MATE family efflux transporter [uncultured Methanobrevibacter sp.]